jgi:hypothetical protein
VPRSTPYRLGRLGVTTARCVGSASAPGCFATLSSRDARLFARELVRGSFLVCRASALGSDCALRLGIHCRKSAWRLATDTTRISRVRSAVVSISACATTASTARSVASASLVHSFPLVVGLVRHYRSPCRDFEFELEAVAGRHRVSSDSVGARPRLRRPLMRKQQAAISGRGRTAGHPVEIVDFFSSPTCVTPYLTSAVFWEPSRAGARQRVWRVLCILAAAPQPLRRR